MYVCCSYGRVEELVYFASLKEQHEIVIHHYIQVLSQLLFDIVDLVLNFEFVSLNHALCFSSSGLALWKKMRLSWGVTISFGKLLALCKPLGEQNFVSFLFICLITG